MEAYEEDILTEPEEELLEIMEEAEFTVEEMETSLETYRELEVTEKVLQLLKTDKFQHSKPSYLKLEAEIILPILKRLKSEGKI